MKQAIRTSQAGFSAVELLIALFIAALFLAAGYQLYTYVVKDGQESSQTAQAADIAYEHLHTIAGNGTYVKTPCSATNQPGSQSLPSSSGLNNASINVVISCPYSSAPLNNTTLLVATLTYKGQNGQETISHALYIGE